MQPVPQALVDRFAQAFCYGRNGYSLQELRRLFAGYGAEVPDVDPRLPPTKGAYFHQCLRSLSPALQRQVLWDLCDSPPAASRPLPSGNERLELLRQLAQADGASALGIELSSLTFSATRELWFVAASRLRVSPASAVTAARSLLEATCKTVLNERGQRPDESGSLDRLFKQAARVLGIEGGQSPSQATYQVMGGLATCVAGLAALSNLGGDRHGLAGGERITERSLAGLAVHAAGTIALFLVHAHKSGPRTGTSPPAS